MMAVNADVPTINVHFLDFPDKEINELGARGISEIGLGQGGPAPLRTQPTHNGRARARTAVDD